MLTIQTHTYTHIKKKNLSQHKELNFNVRGTV